MDCKNNGKLMNCNGLDAYSVVINGNSIVINWLLIVIWSFCKNIILQLILKELLPIYRVG